MLEHGGMVGTQRQVVLVVTFLKFRQELDRLKVIAAIIEPEGKGRLVFADLADHLLVGIGVLLP